MIERRRSSKGRSPFESETSKLLRLKRKKSFSLIERATVRNGDREQSEEESFDLLIENENLLALIRETIVL